MRPLPLVKCPACSLLTDPSATTCLKCERPLGNMDMPFRSMVTLMVKWAFASVPAMIVVFAIVFTMFMIAGLLFRGLATALLSSLR